MSLTFPLTDLIDRMLVKTCEFDLDFNQDISLAGDGGLWVKDLAPPLWQAKLTSNELVHAKALQCQALYNAMGGSLQTFLAWNPLAPYPQADPSGTILGASTVKIHTVDSGMVLLRLKGLPVGYVVTLGDFLCFDYGAGPSRAFHQIAETAVADGTGVTPLFQIAPPLRTGAAADQIVTLKKPAALMRMRPKSFKIGNTSRMKSVVSFEAVQVL